MIDVTREMLRKVIIYFLLSFSLVSALNAQPNRRTNFWYFHAWAGLDFNSGEPQVLNNGMVGGDNGSGSAAISDTNGNLLFYTDGSYIYRKDHVFMYDMTAPGKYPGTQASVIIPKPGSDHIYYAFFVNWWWSDVGNNGNPLYYLTIDMNLAQGFGEVIANDTIWEAWDAADKLMAVYHKDKHDIWVLTRKYETDYFAAIPVTDEGVRIEDIVLSPAPEIDVELSDEYYDGFMKVSYDKKYIITSFDAYHTFQRDIEVSTFNPATGEINFLYAFNLWDKIPPFEHSLVMGLEFSPDSKYLYVTRYMGQQNTCFTYQYDMQYILDSTAFINSYIQIGTGEGQTIQLASDGKLYLSQSEEETTEHLGVINKPWLRGTACDYQPDAVYMGWEKVGKCLPTIMTDFLLRFDFTGQCALDTFYFDPWFFPGPTWIQWNFGDTASGGQNISNELHSKHAFTRGGEFEVSVILTYPNGRVEKTSRVVEVDSIPFPDLGPDTLICKGSSLILNANCNGQFFNWSTGQWGVNSIIVSDTGLYWVKASYLNGCDNSDTIHVGFYPESQFDESGLLITPTSCGGTSGSITGLVVAGTEPLSLEWKDLSGNVLGNTIDLYNLGVGQYYLSVTDGNGCTTPSPIYTIADAGNLQVDSVTFTGAICGQNNGTIQVFAIPQLGGQLLYSIDNGLNFFDNGGYFNNLSPGSYVVMIKDQNDCEGVYKDNPVEVADLAAPQLISATSLPEVDFLQNGEIILNASGSTTDLLYSIDNGTSWQVNNGSFYNLSAGWYDCIIRDENSCDTAFQVEVERFWATILQAIAGNADTCSGTIFGVPVLVENFIDVSRFRMHLSYNNNFLTCSGYVNPDPSVADSLQAFINDATGDILFLWKDAIAANISDQSAVLELVFTNKTVGQGTIDWYSQAMESYFVKSTADTLPAEFTTGTVRVSFPPEISNMPDITLCEGEDLLFFGTATGSNPITQYYWIKPDSNIMSGPGLMFFGVQPTQSGTYTFIAIDSRGCTSEESLLLTIIPTPDPALPNGDTLTLEAGQSIDAGSGFSSYSWNTGETGQTILPLAEGWYKVTVTTTNNCQATDSVFVTFREEPIIEPSQYFYIPNAFTPDGDGNNDIFKPVQINPGLTIDNWHLTIFDRWGGQVFFSDDISVGWDGTKNNGPCPGGVYVYRITFRVDGVSEEQVIVGTVAVVR